MNNFIEYIVRVYPDRTEWLNKFGNLHRKDGPAVEWADGSKEWWVNGKLHRKDGPAVEWADGKEWWVEGKLHRTNGPAIERADGSKEWWVEGKLHRTNGPAIERANGTKEWFVEGKRLSEKEFAEFQSKNPSCAGKIVEIDGRKYQLKEIG